MIQPTFVMCLLDFVGIIILSLAWISSRTNYRKTTGTQPLAWRYQMSEVYSWSATLLPAVAGALIFKVMAMISIWVWLLLDLTDADYGVANFLYNNILNLYVVLFPWIIMKRNKQLRRKFCSRTNPVRRDSDIIKCIKTLEGKDIKLKPSQEDYFDALKDSWTKI